MGDFRKHALFYASLGWKVLPLAPGRKTTLIPQDPDRAAGMGFSGPGAGVNDATDDIDTIEGWAGICPNANVGIAMGKPSGSIFGFDIDTRVTGAEDLLNELIRKHGELPRAPYVRTRSGGFHLYLDGSDAPADFKKKLMKRVPGEGGKFKSVATGLEVKWTGGYLVAPPSYIEPGAEPDGIGGSYTWLRPPLGPNLPKVPKWLLRVFEREPQPRSTGPKSAGNGGRPDAWKLAALVDQVTANGPGSANRDGILYWASKRAIEEVAQGRYGPRAAYDALYLRRQVDWTAALRGLPRAPGPRQAGGRPMSAGPAQKNGADRHGIGGNLGPRFVADADPGLGFDFVDNGPVAISAKVSPADRERFYAAIRSQGPEEVETVDDKRPLKVRRRAIDMATERARRDKRLSGKAFRVFHAVASRSKWKHRYYHQSTEMLSFFSAKILSTTTPRAMSTGS